MTHSPCSTTCRLDTYVMRLQACMMQPKSDSNLAAASSPQTVTLEKSRSRYYCR